MNIKKKIFSALISLYPKPYREHFRESLLQTFDDMQRDGGASDLFIIRDTVVSIPMQYINYFEETMKIKFGKNFMVVALGIVAILGILGINQLNTLNIAHSTFDNYYAFRGCTQLLEKTDTYGICKISSGATIKIVEINNKWYLDGDGPGIW